VGWSSRFMTCSRVSTTVTSEPKRTGPCKSCTRIHRAVDPRLRESNWSNGLAVWHVLHGTRMTGIPQPEIGLPISLCSVESA
jgi:hypothetical protein